MNPYKIEGPALISFSGGRTSGYMLYQILQAWCGQLPSDVHVTFANTGKERDETLDFVKDCGDHWGVDITWLEYASKKGKHYYKKVNYTKASRNGEPFDNFLNTAYEKRLKKGLKGNPLPNPVARSCTKFLKIELMRHFILEKGHKQYDTILGLRYDEPRRVAKQKQQETKNRYRTMPLYDSKVTKQDVNDFWNLQNFNLKLPVINNETPHGNCDLCFLKNVKKVHSLIQENPEKAEWWAKTEERFNNVFRQDRPSYRNLIKVVNTQQDLFLDFDDEDMDCFCHD